MDRVKYLLRKGRDVDERDKHANSALHHAVRGRDREKVKILLNAGASRDTHAKDGKTALHLAVEGGDREIAKILLDAGADIQAKVGGYRLPNQESPLYIAVDRGAREIVELLIERGAKVDKGYQTSTPLNQAAVRGNKDIAKLLLAHGAKFSIHDVAAIGDLARVEELLCKNPTLGVRGGDATALGRAARPGRGG